jgi:hypothetical protein
MKGRPVNMPARLGAAAIFIAAACSSASADIILLEQSREIMARAEDPSSPFAQSVSSSTTGGAFIDSVSVLAGSHWGSASMDSFIGPNGIRATASVEGMGDMGFPMAHGEGGASLSSRFQVTAPTPFRLSGMMEAAGSEAGGGLSFSGPGGQIFNMVVFPGSAPGSHYFDESGTLDPGVYELVANIGASVFTPPGASGGFDLNFALPAPGSTALLGFGLVVAARRRRAAEPV